MHRTGEGRITSNPPGIDCGADCQHTYATGTAVTLTAKAGACYGFVGWGEACSVTGPTCNLILANDLVLNAAFATNLDCIPGRGGWRVILK